MSAFDRKQVFTLPASHDICPVQARVSALESRVDAITDEVRGLSAEVRELSDSLKTTIERNKALNIEMGTQLKRYAEYTERNLKQDNKLSQLLDTLRVTINTKKKSRKS